MPYDKPNRPESGAPLMLVGQTISHYRISLVCRMIQRTPADVRTVPPLAAINSAYFSLTNA
jgi:hypothetical protein